MKKLFCIILSLLMAATLAACGPTDGNTDNTDNIGTVSIKNQESEFHKELEPVKYQEWEEVESVYYKTVFVNDEPCYEVQPVGEEPLQFPVADAVIYGIDDGNNFVEKVTMKLNGEEFTQYQLNVALEAVQEMPVIDESSAGIESAGAIVDDGSIPEGSDN